MIGIYYKKGIIMKKKYVYKVYGKTFTNKKEALKYHHKIYGHANYQASTIYVYDKDKLIETKPLIK